MENNQNIKKPFWKDIKNIIILVLLMSLIVVGVLFFRSQLNQNQIYDLQSQIQTLTTSNNELSSQIEDNSTKIAELENNNTILQNEKETLVTEKTTLETEIQQLKNDNATLTSQIASLKKSSSSSASSTNSNSAIIGSWKTTITESDTVYTTIYEFKSNGDFYINQTKVGTYQNGSILFKDSNDPNFRSAAYNMTNGILYVNLYLHDTDIWVSTDYYKCEK